MQLSNFPFNKNLNPSLTAIIENNSFITYEELINRINFLADYFLNEGIRKYDFVGILSSNNSNFIITVIALWRIGAIPIPLNIRLTANELNEQLNFSGSKFLIQINEGKNLLGLQDLGGLKVLIIEKVEIPKDYIRKRKDIKWKHEGDDTAVILFTSGSAGKPKAVQLTFNNLLFSASNGNPILNQTENDRWLASLPVYHIGGFSIFIRAFLYSSSVIIPKTLQTEEIIYSIQKYKPTLASFVSPQLKRLIDLNIKPNEELKSVLLGGGFINDDLIDNSLKLGWKVLKVYGSTETSSFVTVLTLNEILKGNKSSGKSLKNNSLKIIDENGNNLYPNTTGEILVKSKSVMKGYLNNNDETNKKLKNDFYYTGDIGYLDENGYLHVQARRNDLIVTGGENVNPVEVENELLKHPSIQEACVFEIANNEWGQLVAAAIVTNNNLDIEEIKKILRKSLAGYKIPQKYFFVDELPKTSLGKVKKEELKKILLK